MPAPSSYTEATFAEFLRDELLAVGTVLGWIDATAKGYTVAVTRVERACGVTDIAIESDMEKVEALGRMEVWRSVMAETAGDYNFATANERYDRAAVHAQAAAMFARYRIEAAPYLSSQGPESCDVETTVGW